MTRIGSQRHSKKKMVEHNAFLENHICAWASFSVLPHSFFWHTGVNFIENIQLQ
jgi:hypothetical protein